MLNEKNEFYSDYIKEDYIPLLLMFTFLWLFVLCDVN